VTKYLPRALGLLSANLDPADRGPRESTALPAPLRSLRSMRELPHLREQFESPFEGKLAATPDR
jgi:hypothetical protein